MASLWNSKPAAQDLSLRRAQSGDLKAFEALYRQHVGRVYGLCLRMSGDPARAEEFTQRTFVQAFSALKRFRGDSRLDTWLHRIAVNEILMEARRDKRSPLESADPGDATPAVTGDTDLAIDLEAAVAALPERPRQVFVLRALYGYKESETAALLELALGTVKANYHRARKLLREQLGQRESWHD